MPDAANAVAGSRSAIVLADGEHYPAAVADAVSVLQHDGWDVQGLALLGGSEKLRGEPEYGVPHVTADTPLGTLRAALDRWPVAAVVDLADEPVVDLGMRMLLVGMAAARGARYFGADFVVEPPSHDRVAVPSLAITGTGKRIGKTAVSAHVARLAAERLGHEHVIVVAMGRGGPSEPVVVDRARGPMTAERLLELSRQGVHAASDYLEDAALTGLTTIGCRRVGGGLLGMPVSSNVPDGARLAERLSPKLAIFEGSGACIPPVATDRTLLLATTARPRDLLEGFGPYRLQRADMLLVVGDDAERAEQMCSRARELHPDIEALSARLVPRPVQPIEGRRVAAFTTAPESVGDVVQQALRAAGAEAVVSISHALARRGDLRADVAEAVQRGADCFVVEIKAAAIDVVAEAASEHGLPVVWMDNRPEQHDPGAELDRRLASLAAAAAGVE